MRNAGNVFCGRLFEYRRSRDEDGMGYNGTANWLRNTGGLNRLVSSCVLLLGLCIYQSGVPRVGDIREFDPYTQVSGTIR